ncbi:unnamed protein product, partial [marine sediment metagenome]
AAGAEAEGVAPTRMWRPRFPLAGLERFCRTVVLLVAVSLPLTLVSLEVADGFHHFLRPRFGDALGTYVHHKRHWATLIWVAYTTLVLTVARRRGEKALERAGLAFGVLVLCKLALFDLAGSYVQAGTPLLNSRFATLALEVACLIYLGWEFRRPAADSVALPVVAAVCAVMGHLLGQAAVSMEWVDFCAVRSVGQAPVGGPWGAMAGAARLGAAVLLAGHGAALVFWTALRRKSRSLLATGLCLLSIGAVWWWASTLGPGHF